MGKTGHRMRTSSFVVLLWFILALLPIGKPFPTDEDEFVDYRNVGANHLASWILSQIKHNGIAQPSIVPFGIPLMNDKRNSELTSSIMGIPRTMIDNGKK